MRQVKRTFPVQALTIMASSVPPLASTDICRRRLLWYNDLRRGADSGGLRKFTQQYPFPTANDTLLLMMQVSVCVAQDLDSSSQVRRRDSAHAQERACSAILSTSYTEQQKTLRIGVMSSVN